MSRFDFEESKFEDLLGKTIIKINGGLNDSKMTFLTSGGDEYSMSHYQDCCERVYIESIVGDIEDLIGSPILKAEMPNSAYEPQITGDDYHEDSFTWTFYKLATIKGYVDIRWHGSSNGYYSEEVTFEKKKDKP